MVFNATFNNNLAILDFVGRVMVFNATFNNNLAIS